jgi:histidine triad (HIT) family protein
MTGVPGSPKACTFCSIVAGQLPAHVVFSNETCFAFLDARPLFPGHVLLVPREHRETLVDLPPDEVAPLFTAAQSLCQALETALGADGTLVAINNRVSQSVPHLHVHVVPRRRGDGLRGFFWPRQRYASEAEAAEIAARIGSAVRIPMLTV